MGNCQSGTDVIAAKHAKKLKHLQHNLGDENLKAVAQCNFDTQQALLGQIITMSALLLGFTVTGSLLTVTLTGEENYTEPELIHFLQFAGASAITSGLALSLAFISSVRAATAMEISGPFVAEFVITSGCALKIIVSELCVYISVMTFILSMMQFVWMQDTGPNICPYYRGESATCALLGRSMYDAAKDTCSEQYGINVVGSNTCSKGAPQCIAASSDEDCLCNHYCTLDWEQVFDYSTVGLDTPSGVSSVHKDWFAYYTQTVPGPLGTHVPAAFQQKHAVAATDAMCHKSTVEDSYSDCMKVHADDVSQCSALYSIWQDAEACMDGQLEQADLCRKVCYWDNGQPPKVEMGILHRVFLIPLVILFGLFILGRALALLLRCSRQMRSSYVWFEQFMLGDVAREVAHDMEDGESEDED